MKKTLALVGVGALGVAAGGAGALPAHAEATVPCTDVLDHEFSTEADPGNFYLDCVPLYGLGKAEFTIVPDADNPAVEFPEGFADLPEGPPAVTTTSTLDGAAMWTYFDDLFSGVPGTGPIRPIGLTDEGSNFQDWLALVVAPVTGIGAVTAPPPAAVAELCDLPVTTYGGGWYATFGQVDTTYTQVIDGETWSFTVTGTPATTYYFGSIEVVDDGGEPYAQIDEDEPWCVSDGFGAYTDVRPPPVVLGATTLFGVVAHGLPSEIDFNDVASYGTFQRFEAAAPAPAAEPTLAATGSDPLAPMIAGGFLALLGTALVGVVSLVRRRKQA